MDYNRRSKELTKICIKKSFGPRKAASSRGDSEEGEDITAPETKKRTIIEDSENQVKRRRGWSLEDYLSESSINSTDSVSSDLCSETGNKETSDSDQESVKEGTSYSVPSVIPKLGSWENPIEITEPGELVEQEESGSDKNWKVIHCVKRKVWIRTPAKFFNHTGFLVTRPENGICGK